MTETVHGLPPLLREGLVVAVVPPQLKEDRWHTVRSVSSSGGSGELVSLSGVSGLDEAEALAGRFLLADAAELPEGFEMHDVDALMGRPVVDERLGLLGSVAEVLRGAANDVWVLDGPYGEVLVPVVDEVVLSAEAGGPLRVRVPDGLVDEAG